MGTNYYLRRRIDLNKRVSNNNLPKNIQELKNGYVWHDFYFENLETLSKSYYEELHIGKSSYGWLFLLQGYPYKEEYAFSDDLNLSESFKCIEDYLVEYEKPTTIGIFDEYNQKISLNEFMDVFNRTHQKDVLNRAYESTVHESKLKHLLYSDHDDKLLHYKGIPYRLFSGGDFC